MLRTNKAPAASARPSTDEGGVPETAPGKWSCDVRRDWNGLKIGAPWNQLIIFITNHQLSRPTDGFFHGRQFHY